MTQLEHIEAIEKRLWGTADTLRANSDYASNEYFLPVMGLVFIRHAYRQYLAVKDGIEANPPTRGGKTRALTKEDFSQQSAMIVWEKLSREGAKGGDSSMNVEEISSVAVDTAFHLRLDLGPGLLESVYEAVLKEDA